ncbi:HEAT repeat domain-containing protein [Azospirillum doebereinerae]|uniref:HEAT repeat domain-containing protein n=1 Tax=Azospirillum doebereinerae TaxID=92933 RepID=A0A3S1CH66_9PROT|nr:HEAT repeat domain-containing protein [Azospirillum doebereinerae]RUQ71402.1 HEAT repeat domain-containing protein [Azospirillum doebereinerae]
MALVKAKKNTTTPSEPGPAADPAANPSTGPHTGLTDADPAARRQAARALAQSPAPGAVPALAGRLVVEDDPGVREAILTALVRIGTGEAAAALLPLLDREDAGLRNAVLESVQQMPAAAAAPAVLPLLDHPDSDLRIFAVQLLGAMSHPERLGWLSGVVERDAHVNVCLAAAEALAETGDPAALPSLERLALRFPGDPMVGFSVDAARRRFQGG